MNTGTVVLIVVFVIILFVWWLIVTYNSLVALRNLCRNGWSQVDVQLKRRADLIPNLVETVKGYAGHEKSVFTDVTRARSAVQQVSQGPSSLQDRADAESQLTHAIANLYAVSERYPELKADQNFLDLQNQLKTLENQIAAARQMYNDAVLKYNNKLQMFPSNIVAGIFHFTEESMFAASAQDREVPVVKFSN